MSIGNRHRKCSKLHCFLFTAFISSFTITYYLFISPLPNIILTTKTSTTATFRSHKTTTTATILRSIITTTDCVPFTVPDNRSFFERESSQFNLPRRISNLSDQDPFQHLRSLRLHVLSTARNVQLNIDKFRKYIEQIIDLFHPSSRILICESDSSDKTVEKLYQWPRAQVYQYGNLSKKYPDRVDRITFCRNKLLDIAHQITSDYILVVDLDMFASSIPSFVSNFRYNTDDWSAMTASSRGSYYDIWALRTLSDSVLNFDVWHQIWNVQRNQKQYCFQSVTNQLIGNNQKAIPIDHGLIEVRSAFNGAGLYKTNLTYGCKYSGANSTCEHVPFHSCLREKNQARIFINSEFLLN